MREARLAMSLAVWGWSHHGIETGVIAPGAEVTVTIGPLARPTTFVCPLHNGTASILAPT